MELTKEQQILIRMSVMDVKTIDVNQMNWDKVIELAWYHGVMGLLVYNVLKLKIQLPSDKMKKIYYIKSRLINKYDNNIEELTRISNLFREEGINYAYIKGVALQKTIYVDNPYIRIMRDFDILVDSRKIISAFFLLQKKLGYGTDNMENFEHMIQHRQHLVALANGHFWVELHHRLNNDGECYSIKSEDFIDDVFDDGILSVEKNLLILCWHMYEHEIHSAKHRLVWHADIYNTILFYGESIQWDRLFNYAVSKHMEHIVYYALYRTREVYSWVNIEFPVKFELFESLRPHNFNVFKEQMRDINNKDQIFGQWDISYKNRFFEQEEVKKEIFLEKLSQYYRNLKGSV